MATKHTDECLQKAGDHEPIFVLRSTDVLAPDIVEAWSNMLACMRGVTPKVIESRMQANKMRAWAKEHGSKIPD